MSLERLPSVAPGASVAAHPWLSLPVVWPASLLPCALRGSDGTFLGQGFRAVTSAAL